jgi:Holliday junction resolvasome RuvABC endonuclease subunit
MRCLALDISTSVGWIACDAPGRIAELATWRVPQCPQLGQRLLAFDNWLGQLCAEYRPDVLAFEEPIRGFNTGIDGATTLATLKILQGLAAVAELVAARARVPRCIEVATSTAKKKLAGHGRAKKGAMIRAAILMGVEVADDHQADALAVALCAYEHCGFAVKGYGGPLLADQPRWG